MLLFTSIGQDIICVLLIEAELKMEIYLNFFVLKISYEISFLLICWSGSVLMEAKINNYLSGFHVPLNKIHLRIYASK